MFENWEDKALHQVRSYFLHLSLPLIEYQESSIDLFHYEWNVYKKFEFTPEGIAKRAKATIDFWKGVTPIRSPLNRAFTQLI